MATDRISVRLDAETIKFLEQIGHDRRKPRGAISRGVAAVIEFARSKEPFAFRDFLNNRGAMIKVKDIIGSQEAEQCASDK